MILDLQVRPEVLEVQDLWASVERPDIREHRVLLDVLEIRASRVIPVPAVDRVLQEMSPVQDLADRQVPLEQLVPLVNPDGQEVRDLPGRGVRLE